MLIEAKTIPFCPMGMKLMLDEEMISSDCKIMENVEEDKFIVTNRWNKCLNQIEDLLASGNRCYVTINESELKMTYNTDFSIIDAFWMNFLPKTNSKEVTYLCICGELEAKFHIERGNFYNINFPFEVENVFRTLHGLIIQRKKKSINPVNQLLPFVFSLGHPLDEFLPVIYKPLDNESARYMTSPNMLICHVSAYFSLVLAFNRATCTHSLWKLRKSTEEDRLAAAKHYEESICSIFDTSAMSFRTPVVNLNRSQKMDSSLFHSKILHPNITHHHSALHQHLAASQANSSNQPITHSVPMVSTPMNSKLCKSTSSPGFSRLFSASSAKSVSQYFSPSTFGQTPAHKKYRKLQPSTDSNTLSDDKAKLQEDSTNEIPGEVLNPDICLEKLWDETSENIRSQPKGSSPCKKAFFTRDWMGRKYICYLLAESQQLKCLRLQFEGGNLKNFAVSDSCVICNCDDACGSEGMDIMLVSQCISNIAIYSGMTKIGYLDLDPSRILVQAIDTPLSSFTSSTFLCQEVIATASTPCNSSRNVPFAGYVSTPLAGNASSIYGSTLHDYFKLPTPVSLQNKSVKSMIATSTDFIVTLKSAGIFKVKLPRLYKTKLVALCLQSLKDVLAEEVAFDMLVHWYQQNIMCSEKEELKCFSNFILRSVGLTESTSTGNLHSDTEMNISQEETSPWETMLKLDSVQQLIEEFHFESSDLDSSRRPQSETLTVDYEAPYFIHMPNIYLALSAVYEEARLSRDIPKEIDNLLIMLSTIADALRLVEQKDRFLRNLTHIVLPERQYLIDDAHWEMMEFEQNGWPCGGVFELFVKLLRHDLTFTLPVVVPACCRRTIGVLGFALLLTQEANQLDLGLQLRGKLEKFHWAVLNSTNLRQFASLLFDELPNLLMTLPVGLALPMADRWTQLRVYPLSFPSEIRDDAMKPSVLPPPWFPQPTCFDRRLKECQEEDDDVRLDSFDHEVSAILRCRCMDIEMLQGPYGLDYRKHHVWKEMALWDPIPLNPDCDFSKDKDKEKLDRFLHDANCPSRTSAIGRGAFLYRLVPMEWKFATPPPRISFCGVVRDNGFMAELAPSSFSNLVLSWVFFHHGVANTLMLKSSGLMPPPITSYTQRLEQTTRCNAQIGGELFGLGLNDLLDDIEECDCHELLVLKDPMLSVGLLLGLSANKRRTGDHAVMKKLALHVPFLSTKVAVDLSIEPILQSASILGIGLLFAETCSIKLCYALVQEIKHLCWIIQGCIQEKESYSLSCGMALGFICLGEGPKIFETTGAALFRDLIKLLHGRMEPPDNFDLLRTIYGDALPTPFQMTHVSSAPTIIALGLLFLKTSNFMVMENLKLPNILVKLTYMRPDAALLSILCRSLIDWNGIEPNKEWVESQIPEVLKDFMKKSKIQKSFGSGKFDDYYAVIYYYAVTGACLAIAIKYASDFDDRAVSTLKYFMRELSGTLEHYSSVNTGGYTVNFCHTNILVGLALILAGSGDKEIMNIAMEVCSDTAKGQDGSTYIGCTLPSFLVLGILCLGGGKYGFKKDNFSVACMLCAFYPRYPSYHTDNRHCIQVIRHLYVLALEKRYLIVKDYWTNETLPCIVSYYSDLQEEYVQQSAPLAMPSLDNVSEVFLSMDGYTPIYFEKGKGNLKQLRRIIASDGIIKMFPHTLTRTYKYHWEVPEPLSAEDDPSECPLERGVANMKNYSFTKSRSLLMQNLLRELSEFPLASRISSNTVHQIKMVQEYLNFCSFALRKPLKHRNANYEIVSRCTSWLEKELKKYVSKQDIVEYMKSGILPKTDNNRPVGLSQALIYYEIPPMSCMELPQTSEENTTNNDDEDTILFNIMQCIPMQKSYIFSEHFDIDCILLADTRNFYRNAAEWIKTCIGHMESTDSQRRDEVLIKVDNVVNKKHGMGSLCVFRDRILWISSVDRELCVCLQMDEIRTQKISPAGKAKIQLQLCLHNDTSVIFQFCNPNGAEKQLQDRESVKQLLQVQLAKLKYMPNAEIERKRKILNDDPQLYKLYEQLVTTDVLKADDFWLIFASNKLKKEEEKEQNSQKMGISGGFLGDVAERDAYNEMKLNLTTEIIESIFRTYPTVKEKHKQLVPSEMTEEDFWTLFFQSHYFHRDREIAPGIKEFFADCFKIDNQDFYDQLQIHYSVVENQAVVSTPEGNAFQVELAADEDTDQRKFQNTTLVKRLNYHSNQIIRSHESVAASNSAKSNSKNSEQSSVANKKLPKLTECEELTGTGLDTFEGVHLNVKNDSQFQTFFTDDSATFDHDDAVRWVNLVVESENYWSSSENNPTALLVNEEAVMSTTLTRLSFDGDECSSQSDLPPTIPDDLLSEVHSVHFSLSEVLRLFWRNFPPLTAEASSKLQFAVETLRKFEQNKLRPLSDRLAASESTIENDFCTTLFNCLHAAYSKYEIWLQKRKAAGKRQATSNKKQHQLLLLHQQNDKFYIIFNSTCSILKINTWKLHDLYCHEIEIKKKLY
ncbi:Anaphase-promoting complex subunit 1 [Trichinella sp. T6]|nr:Anaphase-promoting complex subunit 1 [Trichinella sp. T6]